MWSVGHTAWVKFKKLAARQWGECQTQIHVFSFFFLPLLTPIDGFLFIKALGATMCLEYVSISHTNVLTFSQFPDLYTSSKIY